MEFTYPESEYMPLKTHHQLSKIACHNFKERGITEIHGPVTVPTSLDIGNISHRIPTINPYIGICEEPVRYYTKEFSDCTITSYAKETALKAAVALALTGVDIIQSPDILKSNA
jgi:metal-dependent amidase/aminoacylase/carboxypeptidase family protein